MAYGEFYVERQGWARFPKVLIMCRKHGQGIERRRYVPEKTSNESEAMTNGIDTETNVITSSSYSIHIDTWDTDTTPEQQVLKASEELMEVFTANRKQERQGHAYTELADEIADTIQALANLAHKYGIDLARAMERCSERQRERGRL